MKLTVAQAAVRFLAAQRSERDGVEHRLFAGCFGIFGHGNVAGSPVLQELEDPAGYDVSVNDAFRPLSVFFDRVWRPEQLPAALLGAMRALTDPAATGAVTIALPQDVPRCRGWTRPARHAVVRGGEGRPADLLERTGSG